MMFTCLEMRDSEMQKDCHCAPEKLVYQTRTNAFNANTCKSCIFLITLSTVYSGENALPITEESSFNQIVYQSKANNKTIYSFTFLRLSDRLLEQRNLEIFSKFVQKMHQL